MNPDQICLPECTTGTKPGPAPAPKPDQGNDPHPREAPNAALQPDNPEPCSLSHYIHAITAMTKTASDNPLQVPVLVMIHDAQLHPFQPQNQKLGCTPLKTRDPGPLSMNNPAPAPDNVPHVDQDGLTKQQRYSRAPRPPHPATDRFQKLATQRTP
jgi:hypothetical protein